MLRGHKRREQHPLPLTKEDKVAYRKPENCQTSSQVVSGELTLAKTGMKVHGHSLRSFMT